MSRIDFLSRIKNEEAVYLKFLKDHSSLIQRIKRCSQLCVSLFTKKGLGFEKIR